MLLEQFQTWFSTILVSWFLSSSLAPCYARADHQRASSQEQHLQSPGSPRGQYLYHYGFRVIRNLATMLEHWKKHRRPKIGPKRVAADEGVVQDYVMRDWFLPLEISLALVLEATKVVLPPHHAGDKKEGEIITNQLCLTFKSREKVLSCNIKKKDKRMSNIVLTQITWIQKIW